MKTKNKPNINPEEILERMRLAGKFETQAELASFLEMSPQALGSTKVRGSISLAVLLVFAEKTGLSMDFILFGKASDYLSLPCAIGDVERCAPIGFEKSYLETVLRISPSFARSFLDHDGSYTVIDTTHAGQQITVGDYLIKIDSTAVIRQCRKKITGAVAIEGEDEDLSAEQIANLNIVGRVVWRAKSC